MPPRRMETGRRDKREPSPLELPLQHLTQVISPSPGYAPSQIWDRITQSLMDVVPIMKSWGKELNDSDDPDVGTVQNAADGLHDLIIKLRELYYWLEKQDEEYWLELQDFINQVLEKLWAPKQQAFLTTYLQWLKKPKQNPPPDIILTYQEYRHTTATHILDLAFSIELAVQDLREKWDPNEASQESSG